MAAIEEVAITEEITTPTRATIGGTIKSISLPKLPEYCPLSPPPTH